jgi:glutathione synthase
MNFMQNEWQKVMSLVMFGFINIVVCYTKNTFRTNKKLFHTSLLSAKSNYQEQSEQHILKQATSWCGINGLMYTDGNQGWTCAPITFVPNEFSERSFHYAKNVQLIINELIDNISRNRRFITDQLDSVSKSDDFVKRLLEIYNEIPDSKLREGIQFGILRSDYMVNNDNNPLQVEINTIASSFGSLSHKVSRFHKFILNRNVDDNLIKHYLNESMTSESFKNNALNVSNSIVENPSLKSIADGLAVAHKYFDDVKARIIFVVQPNEKNVTKH